MLFLNKQTDLDTLGMWLCPEKVSIDQLNLAQVLQPFQTQGHQLSGLQAAHNPVGWWVQIPLTKSAKVDDDLFRDFFCDVDLSPQACHAHVGRVGGDANTTTTT